MEGEEEIRFSTGIGELDRVLGGGAVTGSLVLVGGAPGIGKSTLLLQFCGSLPPDKKVLYVSGEESGRQLKLRAQRLGCDLDRLYVLIETDLDVILESVSAFQPDVLIVDSIQTMYTGSLDSAPGSVSQIRACGSELMRIGKGYDIPVFIVAHVTKSGELAGPKTVEHMVDCVLYFEGERTQTYRILRAVKNRFGSTNEIGVFEMRDRGLAEVENPSQLLLSGRPTDASGCCVACVMEGSRPILAEVQALVCKSGFSVPRRTATGFDYNRLYLIIAVLEKRLGFFFGGLDVYINVIGGMKLDEPAADLSIALALYSALRDIVVDEKTIAFGELGLGGELRAISYAEQRVKEAERLGFERCILPAQSVKSVDTSRVGIKLIGVKTLKQAFDALGKDQGSAR